MGDCCAGHVSYRVRHVNLQEVTFPSFHSQHTDVALKLAWILHPFELASGEVLAHCLTIHVIRMQILKVMTLFVRTEPITHALIVHLRISMNCLSDASSSTSLEHQQHVEVDYELKANTSLLKAGLLSSL